MGAMISSNPLVPANICSLQFIWTGPNSDFDLSLLRRCAKLENLIIYVSKATTQYATRREDNMRNFWKSNRTRLCDARGIDELMSVRGLLFVCVLNGPAKSSAKRTHEDVFALERLLQTYVLQEKPEGYGEED